MSYTLVYGPGITLFLEIINNQWQQIADSPCLDKEAISAESSMTDSLFSFSALPLALTVRRSLPFWRFLCLSRNWLQLISNPSILVEFGRLSFEVFWYTAKNYFVSAGVLDHNALLKDCCTFHPIFRVGLQYFAI